VLLAAGRTAFLTIEPTPGLPPNDRSRAQRFGPAAVGVYTSYPSMLRNAGFADVGSLDVTSEYRDTQAHWIEALGRREVAVREIMGDEVFEERMTDRTRTLAAIDAGLLARFMYTAIRA
jgi:hypothetical protein